MDSIAPTVFTEEEINIALFIEQQKELKRKLEWTPEFLYIEEDVPSTDGTDTLDEGDSPCIVEIQL